MLRGKATLPLWNELSHDYVGPAVMEIIHRPVLGRPNSRRFFGRSLFLVRKSKISIEENVEEFQFYICRPNFSFLGSIIKKVPKGSQSPQPELCSCSSSDSFLYWVAFLSFHYFFCPSSSLFSFSYNLAWFMHKCLTGVGLFVAWTHFLAFMSGPMTLVVNLLHGATFNLTLVLFLSFIWMRKIIFCSYMKHVCFSVFSFLLNMKNILTILATQTWASNGKCAWPIYASPSSREAYRNRQLTTKILILKWNFLCADMFPYEDSKNVSICLYPEKKKNPGFVNISPALVIDTSMERSSQVTTTPWKPKNLNIFFLKFKIQILTCDEELKLP